MDIDIAHHETFRKTKVSYCGMARDYVLRNSRRMTSNNLKVLRKRANLRQPAVAEAMGVSVPQISRWENGDDSIPSNRLPAMAVAYRATIGQLFDPLLLSVGPTLYVKGEVAAGIWREAFEFPEDDWQTFSGRSDVTVDLENRFGLRVIGESMNLLYPHGSIVECVKLLGGAELKSGKRVVVVRQRDDHEWEATVKEYVTDDDGAAWLWPRSTHPEFQQPWRADRPEPGIMHMEVIAVVVASTRPE